jgi:hypothetical protein
MAYAHAVIEVPRDANDPSQGSVTYKRGDTVPDDLSGIEELREAGSVRDEEYDPSDEPTQVPDFVEIDGVRYVKTGDGANNSEESNAG